MKQSNILSSLEERVLYEDNHLIVIRKLPGELSQGDKSGDTPLPELVKQYLKEKYNKPGNVFLGVIHRLDRPVSGVLMFAKTGKALARMNQELKSRQIEKYYWAVVKNLPGENEARLQHYLWKNAGKNKSIASPKERPDTKLAVLSYRLIASLDNYHLLEVKPESGRHHQIRVQLSKIGSPIKGDVKYGFKRTNRDGSIHLHARRLHFIHPVKKQPLDIYADPPSDNLWQAFLDCLS